MAVVLAADRSWHLRTGTTRRWVVGLAAEEALTATDSEKFHHVPQLTTIRVFSRAAAPLPYPASVHGSSWWRGRREFLGAGKHSNVPGLGGRPGGYSTKVQQPAWIPED